MEFKHISVMLNECIDGLNIKKDGVYIDATMGGAGHSSEIAKRLNEKGLLVGIDKDAEAVAISTSRLSSFKCKKLLVNRDFKDYKQILKDNSLQQVDGILIDLGVSSYQIDNSERGFSYRNNGPLDMRMNKDDKLTAKDIVNNYTYDKLVKIFFEYGEEDFSKNIAKNIVREREQNPIETTLDLVRIIEDSVPKKFLVKSNSVAKIFQALRIEVNGELEDLENVLNDMIDSLSPCGRLCVISFHSLEDRIVKNVFRAASEGCICDKSLPVCVCGHIPQIKLINKKPILPQSDEQKQNTRSTSAKLRIIEKL